MKKAIIYAFSGTGNTLLIANEYKEKLIGYEVDIYRIEMEGGIYKPFPTPAIYDLVGFAYPIHAFNCPKVMTDFVKLLPPVEKLPAFIFKTSGEGLHANDYSSQKIIKILEKKGFDFFQERHYVMRHNIIFPHSDQMVKLEYAYAKQYAALSCSKLLKALQTGGREKLHKNPLGGWFLPILRIEWLYAKLQGPLMSVDKKLCVQCLKCVKSCPLGNITFDGKKFHFGTNCAFCAGCFYTCPKDAIKIGILNGVKLNQKASVTKITGDKNISCATTLQDLKGFKKRAFFYYYKALDEQFLEAGMEVPKFE